MKTIIGGLLIAVVSFVALAWANTTPAVQALIALPGSAGLLAALWEIVRANIEHQHRLDEKRADYAFELSATSHMAEKAFDKHVEFSEKYIAKANEGLSLLFREGPTVKALEIAGALYGIRREFVLWETKEVSNFLNKFEYALRSIGADEEYLKSVERGPKRTQLVEKLYDTFKKVVGVEALPGEPTGEIAVTHIIEKLRDNLGISELTNLRKFYIAEAARRMKPRE